MSCHYAHQRFDVTTRIVVARAVGGPVLLCGLVSMFGAYRLFVALAAVEWAS